MHALLSLVAFAGVIAIVIGGVWMLIRAFSEGILWGLGCLFLPLVSLFFLIVHWRQAKDPFFLQLLGIGIIFGAALLDSAALPGFLR
jgi:FtsH-binding integral membrane protein